MNENVNLDQALNHQFKPTDYTYAERDVSLYALAIGAAKDPLDAQELRFVYELNRDGFEALPTFAVIYPLGSLEQITNIPGLKFNFMNLLHGEQYLEIKRPLPTSGTIHNKAHVSQIYDKGSGALVIVDVHSCDSDGQEVAFNQGSIFIRGLGNFGGERGPSGQVNVPPERAPDATYSSKTDDNQALLYRLASGDRNPLHADPGFAAMVGFPRPILHGLCSFGIAGQAVMKTYAGNEPGRFKSIKARFSKHLFPGETIITEMWPESDSRILFQSRVQERDALVLSNGAVTLVD
jgi:3-hydroxyacyl-CoA dehydrogenase/3a,7a,12a-trihydroxy-5b-cholest-24-enoyl-CoA hydratase